jgi:hypothetical protein
LSREDVLITRNDPVVAWNAGVIEQGETNVARDARVIDEGEIASGVNAIVEARTRSRASMRSAPSSKTISQ